MSETMMITEWKEVSFSDRNLCDKFKRDFMRLQLSSEFQQQVAVRSAVGNFMLWAKRNWTRLTRIWFERQFGQRTAVWRSNVFSFSFDRLISRWNLIFTYFYFSIYIKYDKLYGKKQNLSTKISWKTNWKIRYRKN